MVLVGIERPPIRLCRWNHKTDKNTIGVKKMEGVGRSGPDSHMAQMTKTEAFGWGCDGRYE